jgi:hypothetical protein
MIGTKLPLTIVTIPHMDNVSEETDPPALLPPPARRRFAPIIDLDAE